MGVNRVFGSCSDLRGYPVLTTLQQLQTRSFLPAVLFVVHQSGEVTLLPIETISKTDVGQKKWLRI